MRWTVCPPDPKDAGAPVAGSPGPPPSVPPPLPCAVPPADGPPPSPAGTNPQGPLGPYATAPPALRPEGLSGSDWNGPAPSLRDRRAMEAWLGGAPGEGAAGPPGPG